MSRYINNNLAHKAPLNQGALTKNVLIAALAFLVTIAVALMPTLVRVANENCIPMLSIQDNWTEIKSSPCKSGFVIVKYKPNY